MTYQVSTLFLIFIFSLLSACDGDGSSNIDGIIEKTTQRDTVNSVSYPVSVYLPPNYDLDVNVRYPVLYVLDAEWRFMDTVNFIEEQDKSAIIVGIGNTDRNVTGRRAIDYRMPGAKHYYNFLITQIIPYIDTNYSTDISERTLSGHSLGGLFTGLAVLLEDPSNRYFSHYLSQDGSFWDQPQVTEDLEKALFISGVSVNAEIIIGGAELGNGNGEDAKWFHDLLDIRQYNAELMYWSYQANHSQDFLLSMEDYIDYAY